MKLTFRIEYRTAWGEMLGATLCGNDNQPIMLSTGDGIRWEGSAEMTDAPAGIPIPTVMEFIATDNVSGGKVERCPTFSVPEKKETVIIS